VKETKATGTDVNGIFSRGGQSLIQLLEYCIRSIQMDPVFVYLVQDFHGSPTVVKAVALYDLFCVPNALARLSVQNVLPPLNLRIQAAIRPFKTHWTRAQVLNFGNPDATMPALLPPRQLFDFIATEVQESSKSFAIIRKSYKPRRSPVKNLPGGQMTAPQRHFVEKIWQPIIRPQLTAAGFWRVAAIA